MSETAAAPPEGKTRVAGLLEAHAELLEGLTYHRRQAELARLANWAESKTVLSLSEHSGLPVCPADFQPLDNFASAFPVRLVHTLDMVPLAIEGVEPPFVAVAVPWIPTGDDFRWFVAETGLFPKWYLAPASRLNDLITGAFGVGSGSLMEDEGEMPEEEVRHEGEAIDEEAAIVRFVNEVVWRALEYRATDIHFEPGREDLHIRYRIDGALMPVSVPEELRRYEGAVVSRIKIMANLNISEKRRPQDGRINFRSGNEDLDVRVSTFPTLYGESVSLRLLNRRAEAYSMEDLGLDVSDRATIERAAVRPNGIILVTGPTGSGKSTTLNACLRHINGPDKRIITVEDPVEYEVVGVNQTQINEAVGLTFAKALRHILRQDPDVIMVGEVRDRETADIAIRASLTGHLVFSTLHTNDAAGAITRLIDMEIEPFLIASAVRLVAGQRLIRRLCPACSLPDEKPAAELEALRHDLDVRKDPVNHDFRRAVGCERCRNLGYVGRIACVELLEVEETVHDLILQKASTRQIREAARARGMRTLEESAWNLSANGFTSIEEIVRVVAAST